MFRPNLPKQQPYRTISAQGLNAYTQEMTRQTKIRGSGALQVSDPPIGQQIHASLPELIYASLTGPANEDGGYPWKEWLHVHNSTWALSGRVGGNVSTEDNFDPTYERKYDSRTVPTDGHRYRMQRANTTGQWLFVWLRCDADLYITLNTCGLPGAGNTIELFQAGVKVAECISDTLPTGGFGCIFEGIPQGNYDVVVTSPQGPTGTGQVQMIPPCQSTTQTIFINCYGVPNSFTTPAPTGLPPFFLQSFWQKTFTYGDVPDELRIVRGNVGQCFELPEKLWFVKFGAPPGNYWIMTANCTLTFRALFFLGTGTPSWALSSGGVFYDVAGTGDGLPNTCAPFNLYNGLSVGTTLVEFSTPDPLTGVHSDDDGPMRSGGIQLVACP